MQENRLVGSGWFWLKSLFVKQELLTRSFGVFGVLNAMVCSRLGSIDAHRLMVLLRQKTWSCGLVIASHLDGFFSSTSCFRCVRWIGGELFRRWLSSCGVDGLVTCRSVYDGSLCLSLTVKFIGLGVVLNRQWCFRWIWLRSRDCPRWISPLE